MDPRQVFGRAMMGARGTGVLVLALLAMLATACSDSEDDPMVDDQAGDGDGPSDPNKVSLDPPAEGRGIQLSMTTTVPASQDVEHCLFVKLGPDELIINHDEARFAGGSHHVLVYTTSYDKIPTENEFGEEVDTSGPFDCSVGVQGFWATTGLISASQNGNGESGIAFPEGVGMRMPGDSVLIINAHYVNATESEIEPEILINLHTISEDELEEEGGLLFWYHPFLKVPAGAASVARAGCEITQDIRLVNAQSHMHKLGVGYVAELFAPGEDDGEVLYEGSAWEDVPVEHYSPMVEIEAGSRIEWECEFQNASEDDVYQGPRSFDEMCMFIGSYFPRNEELSYCAREGNQFLAAEWMIGDGDKTCKETFQCVAKAAAEVIEDTESRGPSAITTAITECMVESDPGVSAILSEAVGCMAIAEEDPFSECAEEISACMEI